MIYVVGTASITAEDSYGPTGTLHAIRLEDVYTGIALCGTVIHAWADIDFPTGRPRRECPRCQLAAAPTVD